MSRPNSCSLLSLSIVLLFCVSENAVADGSMLSRIKVGQLVTFEKAASGGFSLNIVPADQSEHSQRDTSMICEIGDDFVMVKAANGSTKMISAHAIDVVTHASGGPSDEPVGFAGTWRVGDGVELSIVVDGDQVTATVLRTTMELCRFIDLCG